MSINFLCQLIIYVLKVVVRCDVQIENKLKQHPKKQKTKQKTKQKKHKFAALHPVSTYRVQRVY